MCFLFNTHILKLGNICFLFKPQNSKLDMCVQPQNNISEVVFGFLIERQVSKFEIMCVLLKARLKKLKKRCLLKTKNAWTNGHV